MKKKNISEKMENYFFIIMGYILAGLSIVLFLMGLFLFSILCIIYTNVKIENNIYYQIVLCSTENILVTWLVTILIFLLSAALWMSGKNLRERDWFSK